MNLNATLLGQMITFALFVGFTMKFVWPHLMKNMEKRRKKIADGLAAAEQGHRELEMARRKATDMLRDAKADAADIMDKAHARGNGILEDAKDHARSEGARMMELAKQDIEREGNKAKAQLRKDVVKVTMASAEKILERSIDESANQDILNKAISEI